MTQLLIISQHPAFAESLSAIAARELGWNASVSEAYEPKFTPDLVVAHTEISPAPACPVIVVKAGKPMRIQALIAQMQQALQRDTKKILNDGITLFTREKRLVSGDKEITLTDKEQALIIYLHEHKAAHKAELLQAVWGMSSDIDTHTLETHIYRLRQKWREISPTECIIANENGYSWNV